MRDIAPIIGATPETRKGAVLHGIGHGAGDGLLTVDVTQGHDFAHVMVRVEASLFELSVIGVGLGRESAERAGGHGLFCVAPATPKQQLLGGPCALINAYAFVPNFHKAILKGDLR